MYQYEKINDVIFEKSWVFEDSDFYVGYLIEKRLGQSYLVKNANNYSILKFKFASPSTSLYFDNLKWYHANTFRPNVKLEKKSIWIGLYTATLPSKNHYLTYILALADLKKLSDHDLKLTYSVSNQVMRLEEPNWLFRANFWRILISPYHKYCIYRKKSLQAVSWTHNVIIIIN